MLASAPWPAVRPVENVPSQPVVWDRPWACSSWPSETVTRTLVQLMPAPVVPSSGSVTEILYGTLSVNDGDLAVLRHLDRHHRRAVADRDDGVRDAGQAARVGDRELDLVAAVVREGVARVGGRRGAAVAEVPRVGHRRALGVGGAGAGEVDRQRREALVGVAVACAMGFWSPLR